MEPLYFIVLRNFARRVISRYLPNDYRWESLNYGSSRRVSRQMNRVTGIGGIFFKAKDPKALQAWYKLHLGIDVQDWGGTSFPWTDAHGKPAGGSTVWC